MSIILKGIDLPKYTNLTITIKKSGEIVIENAHESVVSSFNPHVIQIPYDVEDIVDDVVKNHELYKKGGWII